MKDDIPLLNQPSKTRLLGAEWMAFEAQQLVANQLAFERIRRVHELRKSAGVEPVGKSTIHVRLPPRYLKHPV